MQQITVTTPIERAWAAITEPSQLAGWFGDSADVDLRPGGAVRFGWSEYGESTTGEVISVDRPNLFSFRWNTAPDADGVVYSTLVTFSLAERDGATTITVEESGLSALPEDLRNRTLEENTSGWIAELGDLRSFLETGTEAGA